MRTLSLLSILLVSTSAAHAESVVDLCKIRKSTPCYDINIAGFPATNPIGNISETNSGVFLRATSFAMSNTTKNINAVKFTDTHQYDKLLLVIRGTNGIILTRIDGYYYQLPLDGIRFTAIRRQILPSVMDVFKSDLYENGQRVDFSIQYTWSYTSDKSGGIKIQQRGNPCIISPHGIHSIGSSAEIIEKGSSTNATVNVEVGTSGTGDSIQIGAEAKGISAKATGGSIHHSSNFTAKFGVEVLAVDKYACSLAKNVQNTISELGFTETDVRSFVDSCKIPESSIGKSAKDQIVVNCSDDKK